MKQNSLPMFRFRILGVCLSLLMTCLGMTSAASAGTIRIDTQATITETMFLGPYFATGQALDMTLEFQVSGNGPSFPNLSLASGTLKWNDGIARTGTITADTGVGWIDITGRVSRIFKATGPTINNADLDGFGFVIDIGTNPLNVTDPWESIFLGATVSGISFSIQYVPTLYSTLPPFNYNIVSCVAGCADEGVSGSISTVPEPGSFALFGLGLAGLLASSRMRKQ